MHSRQKQSKLLSFALMHRFAIAVAIFASFALAAAAFSQDKTSSPAPPAASASQESGNQTQAPTTFAGGPNANSVLRICGVNNPPPCANGLPRTITAPGPQYSKKAREQKFQGTTVAQLIVGADGHPRDIVIMRPQPYGLNKEAIKALKEWRFKPATMNGQPVAVQVNVEVDFRLY
jgi:TonB family protein